ncbi:hypothetical protein PPYR_02907 [Photinus pyralis]|uniref:Phospholipid scramblase n=2 Tax=Photinus pyralis TaxID=7054 RepID=A0A5N4A1A7_PHOPY|nr:hypothetical protein PPYR_02907 [Photinus pyralis]
MATEAKEQFFKSTHQAPQEYHMGFTLPHDAVLPPPLPAVTTQIPVRSPPEASQYPWPNTTQPTATNNSWMNQPQKIPNCPPGLEYLAYIDQLIIHQTTDALQTVANFETENQYYIANKNEQKVYYAKEKSDACARNCFKAQRSFEMKVFDNFGKEVIHMNRPFACQAFCFFCCLQSMEVFSPPETPVGSIEQECNLFSPSFAIKNDSGEVVLRIKGPCSLMPCCSSQDFEILSVDGNTQVGKILRKSSDHLQAVNSKEDCFGLLFPANLDVRMKAVLIGACFLIDMMYFEAPTRTYEDERPNHISPI